MWPTSHRYVRNWTWNTRDDVNCKSLDLDSIKENICNNITPTSIRTFMEPYKMAVFLNITASVNSVNEMENITAWGSHRGNYKGTISWNGDAVESGTNLSLCLTN
jgi:hypothetical protein